MTPEEIKAKEAADAATKLASEEQSKADEKAAKDAEKNKGKEKASNDAAGVVSHKKHVHTPGKYSLKDVVTFVCEYPSDYKGRKHLKEGTHKVHRLTAERLQTKRIGKIVG